MTKKYCPIKHDAGGDMYVCDREDCAWWSLQEATCAVVAIASHLRLFTISRSGSEW